jgi:hypothetical protein
MTDRELMALHRYCIAAGLSSTDISPRNPFEMKGKNAVLIQAWMLENEPELAAQWQDAAEEGTLHEVLLQRGLVERTPKPVRRAG